MLAAGNTLDETIALTTAANSIMQSPQQVGNALKVVSMRLRGTDVKKISNEIGEDVDMVDTSFAKLYGTIKKLTAVKSNDFKGVSILTDTNEFRGTTKVLLDIAKIWDEIGSASQAALLEQLAGKTRGAVVAAILQNGEMIEEILEGEGEKAAGATDAAMEVALDSIDSKVKRLTQSWQSLWQNFIDTDLVKDVLDLLNGILQVLDKIIGTVSKMPAGGLIPMASTLAAGSTLLNNITALNGQDKAVGFDFGGMVLQLAKSARKNLAGNREAAEIGGILGKQLQEGFAQSGADINIVKSVVESFSLLPAKQQESIKAMQINISDMLPVRQKKQKRLSLLLKALLSTLERVSLI